MRRHRLQFRLSTLLYVITAVAIYLAVDRATAFTRYNDPLGGAVIYAAIGGWFLFRRFRDRPSKSN